ncbi:hypothetical protein PTTG_28022 [Puccinia triticina 1-1 BBBD Race 1]|uniref:Uncharacterized protein n=1 Tax=Puccinia triticina (isolate 1-1 / race 1 (BBBD)) TaxID=630390 RepID=A0A180GF99_PUCT1|nr:hypothetical protein PTTG_28022 [Puccinia triticina 1-1 BBBD Race 1]
MVSHEVLSQTGQNPLWPTAQARSPPCQDSGSVPEQRKRKDLNPNPARGIAMSTQDEAPKRYKQALPNSSTLATDANSEPKGSSLSDRITQPTSGDAICSGSLASRIGSC